MSLFRRLFVNSSLVPLAKIANAKDRSVRIVWGIFTATMCVGLLICISFVVRQYMQHQTAFQLDSSSEDFVYDQLPGVTICLSLPTAEQIRKQLQITLNKTSKDEIIHELKLKWMRQSNNTWDYRSKGYFLPIGKHDWNSEIDARSLAYSSFYHFKINFDLGENKLRDRVFIIEQIPNGHMISCTTFEFRPIKDAHTWSALKFQIEQTSNQPVKLNQTLVFTMILHERGELPFSAYDRFIYSEIRLERAYSVYMSKSVMQMLNTKKNPCHDGKNAKSLYATLNKTSLDNEEIIQTDLLDRHRLRAMQIKNPNIEHIHSKKDNRDDTINLFGTNFLYSRESCGWSFCCRKVLEACNAHCATESFGLDIKKLNHSCENNQCYQKPISYDVCPGTCVTARLTKQNFIESKFLGNESNKMSSVNIYKSSEVEIAIEEEIFTLAKLFSEIGGLCSLFIGFSSTFIFELLEGLLYLKPTKKIFRLGSSNAFDNEKEITDDDNYQDASEVQYSQEENFTLTDVGKKVIPLILPLPNLNNLNMTSDKAQAFPVLNKVDEYKQSVKSRLGNMKDDEPRRLS